jgi:hypothetical protein
MAIGMDPEDWTELRALGHRILDDMFDRFVGIRDRPVWQRMPDGLRAELRSPLPHAPETPALATSGPMVIGTSMANTISVLVVRRHVCVRAATDPGLYLSPKQRQ